MAFVAADGDSWHLVEARRENGASTLFRIRELDPQPQLARIFVVEMPYPTTELSRLPNALGYRKLAQFEEQWILPACHALGWELVALKIEDGSFFLYMYGSTEPDALMARLAPYDAALGFYEDEDPAWEEYASLRELLEQAKAMPVPEAEPGPKPKPKPKRKPKPKPKPKPKRKAKRRPKVDLDATALVAPKRRG